MPPIKVEEIWQDLISQVFAEDIELDPEAVKRFFVNNLVQRTLAHLVGQGRNRGIPILATEAGALKVAEAGGGTSRYETLPKAAITDTVQTKTFDNVCSRVDVTTWDKPVILQLSDDGTTFGEDIVVNAGVFYSIDQSVKAVKYKNETTDGNATLQLVGFY